MVLKILWFFFTLSLSVIAARVDLWLSVLVLTTSGAGVLFVYARKQWTGSDPGALKALDVEVNYNEGFRRLEITNLNSVAVRRAFVRVASYQAVGKADTTPSPGFRFTWSSWGGPVAVERDIASFGTDYIDIVFLAGTRPGVFAHPQPNAVDSSGVVPAFPLSRGYYRFVVEVGAVDTPVPATVVPLWVEYDGNEGLEMGKELDLEVEHLSGQGWGANRDRTAIVYQAHDVALTNRTSSDMHLRFSLRCRLDDGRTTEVEAAETCPEPTDSARTSFRDKTKYSPPREPSQVHLKNELTLPAGKSDRGHIEFHIPLPVGVHGIGKASVVAYDVISKKSILVVEESLF